LVGLFLTKVAQSPSAVTIFAIIQLALGAFVLEDHWQGDTFFNGWGFFTGGDPTNGVVDYVTQAVAQQKGYIGTKNGQTYIGCDMTTVVGTKARGRQSVRINTQKTYQSGLFIFDLTHMPTGCATWPAFWTVGPGWPTGGEIDIIEGINVDSIVHTTLHTNNGCTMAGEPTGLMNGNWVTKDCNVNAPGQEANQGCSITGLPNSYGAPFNAQQGGVYVTQWNSTVVRMWFFPRGSIPADITSGNPNPDSWGLPYSYFVIGAACPANHFHDHQIVINLTFCGDWAGKHFATDCPQDGNCATFVRNNPTKFTEAYWLINYLSVYQQQ